MNCPKCGIPMAPFRNGLNRERFRHPDTLCSRRRKHKPRSPEVRARDAERYRGYWQRKAVELDQRWEDTRND